MNSPERQVIAIDSPAAVVAARRIARQFATDAGLRVLDQTRFATAVSEIARNALLYASAGRLELAHIAEGRRAVVARVDDQGPGIKNLDDVLEGKHDSERGLGRGLAGTQSLVDEMRIETGERGTTVELVKYVGVRNGRAVPPPIRAEPKRAPRPAPPPRAIELDKDELLDDLREQNDALLQTIQGLVEAERALAKNRKRLALAIDLAGIGTFEWREDGSIACGEHYRSLLGFESAPADVQQMLEHIHEDDRDNVQRELVAVLERAGVASIDFRSTNGRWLSARLCADDVETERGTGMGVVLDVTSHRRAEARARERVRFQQQLIGIVSHDLRSPLQVANTAATLLPELGPLTPEQKKTTSRILSSAHRATRLVQDLLDFARSSLGGRLPVSPGACDLGELADHIAQETKSLDQDHDLELKLDGDLQGTWDADRLSQVMTNLLHNAFLYSPAGSTVTLSVCGRDAATVELSVHNAGEPVPPELLASLFEPLDERTRPENGRTRSSAGLGLFIVRAVALAHGGEARAESTAAGGTLITVTLPRHAPE